MDGQTPGVPAGASEHGAHLWFPGHFVIKLLSVLRVGARYAFLTKDRDDQPFERADIELDGTWEKCVGAYHDSSASSPEYTRLDFDTLDKTTGTVGVGLKIDAFEFSLALA